MESNYVQQLSHSNFPTGPAGAIQHITTKTQAPIVIACTSVLSTMAFSCQGNIDVECHGVKSTSLNTFTIASSGERKSTTDNKSLQAIIDMETNFELDFHNKMIDYNNELEMWKLENDFLKKSYLSALKNNDNFLDELKRKFIENNNSKPKRPKKYKLLYEDVTIEAILEGLADGSFSILLTSNEGGIVTKGSLFHSAPILNKIWDNQSIRIDRKSVPSFIINGARLSIALMIQLGLFEKLIGKYGNELRSSGFLARCLICQPQSTQGWRMKQNDDYSNEFRKSNEEEFNKYQEKVRSLIKRAHDRHKNNEAKELMKFTDEAQLTWDQQYNWAEMQLRINGWFYDFKDVGSRYMEQISRVAAILQYFTTDQLLIEKQTLILAIDIVNYYTSEFIRIFKNEADVPEAVKNAETLYRWLSDKILVYPYNGMVKKNDIRKYGPNCIRDKLKLNEAIDILLTQRRIQLYRHYTPKPTIWIQVISEWSSL